MHLHLKENSSLLQKFNHKTRFLYFLFLLLLILTSKSPLFLLMVFLSHFFLLLFLEKEKKELFSAYLEPVVIVIFLLLIKSLSLSSFRETLENLSLNLYLPLRVLSAFTVFYFFYVSLSFFEAVKLLNSLRVPPLFQELFFLSIKFITLLKEEVALIYLSQKNRLGYSGFKNSIRSLQYLSQASFFQALRSAENVMQSMEQRGFEIKNITASIEPLRAREFMFLFGLILFWSILWMVL